MRRLSAGADRLEIGVMTFQLGDVKSLISERAGAEPGLRGAETPVYEIAAPTRGQTVAEIVEDYPGLTPALVEAAAEYAKVYPKPGRPLPGRSLKRMLSDMASSGVCDVESNDGPMEPRSIP